MLNKKGSSLLELIVSIALISVVLAFMVKMLVDLNDQETNNTFAKDNQINRAEIIRMVEGDLNSKVITDINDTGSSQNELIINFKFSDNTTAKITATKDSFTYLSSAGATRKWEILESVLYPSKATVYYGVDTKTIGKNLYSLVIDIEIHTVNDRNKLGNNNSLDDILISYLGEVDDFNKTITCLGDNC